MKKILASIFLLSINIANAAAAQNWYVPAIDFGSLYAPGGNAQNRCWGMASGINSKPSNDMYIDTWRYKYVSCDTGSIPAAEMNTGAAGNLVKYLYNSSLTVPSGSVCTAFSTDESNYSAYYNCIVTYNGKRYGCFDENTGMDACDYCVDSLYRDGIIGRWETVNTYYAERTVQKYVVSNYTCKKETTREVGCAAGAYYSKRGCEPCPDNATCTQTAGHTDSFTCKPGYYKTYLDECSKCPDVEIIYRGSPDDGEILSNPNLVGIEACYLRDYADYIDGTGTFFITDNCYYVAPEP